MAAPDLSRAQWRKSSRSNGQGGACVEIARNLPSTVAIRDSKNPTGPALTLEPTRWTTFTDIVKRGTFDC